MSLISSGPVGRQYVWRFCSSHRMTSHWYEGYTAPGNRWLRHRRVACSITRGDTKHITWTLCVSLLLDASHCSLNPPRRDASASLSKAASSADGVGGGALACWTTTDDGVQLMVSVRLEEDERI